MPLLAGNGAGVWVVLLIGWGLAAAAWMAWLAGRGPALFASWEDTITAFMAPRSGKTTTLSIPYVLSAPGAVVATSNKADLWAATAQIRAASGSMVWLFDPQLITGSRQRWWWNPLAGLGTVEAAHRLAAHFVLTVDDNTRRDLW